MKAFAQITAEKAFATIIIAIDMTSQALKVCTSLVGFHCGYQCRLANAASWLVMPMDRSRQVQRMDGRMDGRMD